MPKGVRISTILFVLALGYIAVNAFAGQQGLLAWRAHAARVEALQVELATLAARRAHLESRIAALGRGAADADLVEERAWSQLGLAPKGTIMVDLPVPASPQVP